MKKWTFMSKSTRITDGEGKIEKVHGNWNFYFYRPDETEETIHRLQERVRDLEEKYNELLMAVGYKFPGESRHDTALRYIREAEMTSVAGNQALQHKEEKR